MYNRYEIEQISETDSGLFFSNKNSWLQETSYEKNVHGKREGKKYVLSKINYRQILQMQMHTYLYHRGESQR